MKKMMKTLPVAAALVLMAACSGGKGDYQKLIANEWVLESVEHADSANQVMIPEGLMIQFSDSSKVYGNGPCNRFFGSYEIEEKNDLDFGNLATTMAFCPEMNFETSYFIWLDDVDKYEVKGNSLVLKDDDNKVKLFYTAKAN